MTIVFLRLLLFLLPFLAFALWVWLMRREKSDDPGAKKRAERWQALAGIGLIASVALSLGLFALTSEDNTEGQYTAPRHENGEVVPGTID